MRVFVQSAPGRIRTCGLRVRSPALYPAELRAHSMKGISYQFPSKLSIVNVQKK
jgi:hypothetical protein